MTERAMQVIESDEQTLNLPIQTVLLMEDRAQVTRRLKVQLVAGRNFVRAQDVSPLAADRTLRCRISALSGSDEQDGENLPRVLDAGVRREYLIRSARPEKEQELRAAMEALVDEYLAAYDAGRSAFGARDLLSRTLDGLQQEILDRLVVGPFDDRRAADVERVFARRDDLEKELLQVQFTQEDRVLRLERLAQELRQALGLRSDYRASLYAELWLPQAGEYDLEFEYQVPCALWRPSYAAELQLDGAEDAQVSWRAAGTVWQATGEDWNGVELLLSTARPTLGAELPLLEDDLLSARTKTDREKKVVEVSSRDQVIAKTGEAPEREQSDTPPGLDDGGEARTYSVPDKVDVPADGRPHRLEFDSWTEGADCEWVCLPEKAQFVFLRSVQKNPSALPLLAGPVQLIRNGAYVGRSQIRFVAPEERFELSWGSEDGIVVIREVDRDYEETAIRKRKKHDFKVEIFLTNHSGQDQKIKLMERVPVSEMEQVEVSLKDKETTTGFFRDEQGLLTWDLDVKAGAEKMIELSFQVSTPSNVVWNG